MIIVAGSIPIKPEMREEAIAAALEMAAETQKEEGCIEYQFYADISDPNRFLVFERWASGEALAAHFGTAHMAAFRQKIPSFVAGPSNIYRYEAGEGVAV